MCFEWKSKQEWRESIDSKLHKGDVAIRGIIAGGDCDRVFANDFGVFASDGSNADECRFLYWHF